MFPSEFVKLLYPSIPNECQDSKISLWNKQTKESIHVAPPYANPEKFDALVQQQVDLGRDVYFGVALRRPNLTDKQRGKVSDCRALPGLFLDLDINTEDKHGVPNPHAAKNLPKTEAQCAEILEDAPAPTGIIDSGHGWHVYWLFDNLHPISYIEANSISESSEAFQRKIIARANALGYHVDFTGNIDRVLRVPGTINYKANLKIPVQEIFFDGPRYASLNTLLEAAGVDKRATLAPNSFKPTRVEDIDQTLLEPREDHAKAQTTEWIKDALSKLVNPESKELMESVLQGKAFAPAGARDQTLQRIASIIAYIAPDRSPEELAVEILDSSLATFEPDDKGKYTQEDRLVWAAEKIQRAQEDSRRDRIIKERHDSALAEVLLKQARSAPRRDQRLGPANQGPYTDHEIASFAGQQNTTTDKFAKRWIIQKGQSFYVYINGDYQLPLSITELDVSLPRDLSPAVANGFIKLDTTSAKGEPRKKTTKEILSDYASVARTVVARLDIGYSYYDEDTQTFYEASCPIRPLAPAFNADVDKWLRLLGASKLDLLLDWVATVTRLDKQSSALYLQGPPGTGKSLLSQGLARLWHRGGPTELVRVLGDWTGDMARCPLIVADEQIPQNFKGQRTSAELRSLIGNGARTLTRKFRDNSDLVGAVRLILSANNADMLVFEESLSQADLEAVAGRFLHIKGDIKAAQFLNTIDTTGWVDDDIIAKHTLWLRDNRSVIPGRRFLVEGSARDVSKQLATRGGVAGRVAEWLVRYLCETPTSSLVAKQSSPQQSDMVRVGNGRYLVNTNAIVTFWEQYAKSKQVPSTPQVGSALRNLSTRQVKAGTKRYFEIDIEAIASWSEANLIGDSRMIQDRIIQEYAEDEIQEIKDDAGPSTT
jgi:hypothetical protein